MYRYYEVIQAIKLKIKSVGLLEASLTDKLSKLKANEESQRFTFLTLMAKLIIKYKLFY